MSQQLIVIILLLLCVYAQWQCGQVSNEGFSPSTVPFSEDNTLLNRNPFDDVDYQVPMFYKGSELL
jgi:hypothetical protein